MSSNFPTSGHESNPVPNGNSGALPPPSTPPFLAELVPVEPTPARSKKRWMVVLLCGIVSLVIAGFWVIPYEMRQWRLAIAEEKRLNGDLPGALAQLEEDLKQRPTDLELLRRKARWLMENRQLDAALQQVNQLLRQHPTDLNAYMLRAEILQQRGEHTQAIDDWKHILAFDVVNAAKPVRATALNGLAYARSLANVELDEGLVDIEEAMGVLGENYALLDTRGFLYFRAGELDRAIADLEHAVEYAEAEYEFSKQGYAPFADARLHAEAQKARAQSLAVIRYHRALIHEARGEKREAEADRQRVRDLGFEPNEKLF